MFNRCSTSDGNPNLQKQVFMSLMPLDPRICLQSRIMKRIPGALRLIRFINTEEENGREN